MLLDNYEDCYLHSTPSRHTVLLIRTEPPASVGDDDDALLTWDDEPPVTAERERKVFNARFSRDFREKFDCDIPLVRFFVGSLDGSLLAAPFGVESISGEKTRVFLACAIFVRLVASAFFPEKK